MSRDAQVRPSDHDIAAWLRDGVAGAATGNIDRKRLLHRIDLNGVGPLLALSSAPDMPSEISEDLHRRLVARELWEAQHQRVLAGALEALTQAGLRPILLKGSALALSHYPTPAARVRGDSDILVEQTGRAAAISALRQAGFSPALAAGGRVLVGEMLLQKADASGLLHDIDLHWRLNSSAVLARLFSHEELLARSGRVTLAGLEIARTGDVDSLVFAAVHRRLHVGSDTEIILDGHRYATPDSLTWLMDIHLLFKALDEPARSALVERSLEKGVAALVAGALRSAAQRLGTPVPEALLERLESAAPTPVDRYIAASGSRRMAMNLVATRGAAAKASFLRELLFPPPAYMRRRFARGRFDWLPVLYLRRGLSGLTRQVRHRRNASVSQSAS